MIATIVISVPTLETKLATFMSPQGAIGGGPLWSLWKY